MEYNKLLADMVPGDRVEGFYILKEGAIKTSNSGKPFLSATVTDKSGSLDLKAWDYSGPVGAPTDAGKVVKIRADVTEYRGSIQLTASNIRMATQEDSYDVSALVPVAPIDRDETLEKVRSLIASMEDRDYRVLAETMLERHLETFRSIPAAKSVHHSFLSGLLMHTANMLSLADFLAGQYSQIIDRSLLLTGTLLHDFAKEKEFTFSQLGIVTDYSRKGQLLGHLVMGAQEVGAVCAELDTPEEKSLLLQHMILSHHGEPEFGAAVKPMFAEADLLSQIDMLDSRMEIYAETLPGVPTGTFSSRIFSQADIPSRINEKPCRRISGGIFLWTNDRRCDTMALDLKKERKNVVETIASVNAAVNSFVWGVPAMICIVGVGLLLSFWTGFIQFRRFGTAMKETFGSTCHGAGRQMSL